MRLIILLALLISVTAASALAEQSVGSGTGGAPARINMEISHSDYLPSLPPSLHKGNYFTGWSDPGKDVDRRRMPRGEQGFVIPRWLAGKWKRDQSTETRRVELPSGKAIKTTGTTTARSEDVFGT